ncbi:hypothetical protein J1N35_043845 [Gossypium stocksii]|uniref:Uncharacterized protein n=1 Tax=Gossypium stocksii TaxID=47602 RepID=A0A9D3ZFG5_9ROSI|nr:hypothetical protein J1N35_043845 [Gossypium stocksii]
MNRLSLLKLKKIAKQAYMGRQVEVDYHCIKDEKFGSNCPTAHPGFSLSIIYFLLTICTVMITLYAKVDLSASSYYPTESNPKSISGYHFLTMFEIVE